MASDACSAGKDLDMAAAQWVKHACRATTDANRDDDDDDGGKEDDDNGKEDTKVDARTCPSSVWMKLIMLAGGAATAGAAASVALVCMTVAAAKYCDVMAILARCKSNTT